MTSDVSGADAVAAQDEFQPKNGFGRSWSGDVFEPPKPIKRALRRLGFEQLRLKSESLDMHYFGAVEAVGTAVGNTVSKQPGGQEPGFVERQTPR